MEKLKLLRKVTSHIYVLYTKIYGILYEKVGSFTINHCLHVENKSKALGKPSILFQLVHKSRYFLQLTLEKPLEDFVL